MRDAQKDVNNYYTRWSIYYFEVPFQAILMPVFKQRDGPIGRSIPAPRASACEAPSVTKLMWGESVQEALELFECHQRIQYSG